MAVEGAVHGGVGFGDVVCLGLAIASSTLLVGPLGLSNTTTSSPSKLLRVGDDGTGIVSSRMIWSPRPMRQGRGYWQ